MFQFFKKKNQKSFSQAESTDSKETGSKAEDIELTAESIKKELGDSSDIIIRDLFVNGDSELPVTLIFTDGLVNGKNVDDDILKPLLQETVISRSKNEEDIIYEILHGGLYHGSATARDKAEECLKDILSGSAALVFSKSKKAVTFDIKGFEKRSITEPTGENVIKGSKDSFIEVVRVNTALIRRKIKTPKLRIKEVKIGRQTMTSAAVVYIEGLTDEEIVKEVFKRLDSIKIDAALTTGAIEEYIIDNRLSLFPQVLTTERPDKFCANILEGRVGLIVDGLPTGYVVPATLQMFLQAPEDYSNNYAVASLIRLLRYISYVFSLTLPAFYISVTTFQQEMIPTDLAISIAKSKEGVPFPTFVEVIIMVLAFEILTEGGLRLPKNIGQAISIIGSVVVGQAAVAAKLVSPGVVIAVSLTGIAGFTMPNQDFSNAVRVWRVILIAFAVAGGLFSMVIGLIVMGYILARMESFGVPYFSPFAGNDGKDMVKDTLIRLPLFTMKKRPSELNPNNERRQA